MNTLSKEEFYLNLKKFDAYLHFEDGKVFKGKSNRPLKTPVVGEAAFTTGLSGYEETTTDPSFLGQHIIFTNSHIGNYDSDPRVSQSKEIHGTSIIARNISYNKFFASTETPLVTDMDTRSLVQYLTEESKDHKAILTNDKSFPSHLFSEYSLRCNDLDRVSTSAPIVHTEGENPVVLIDYGVKAAIIDQLKNLNIPLVSLPHNSSKKEILSYNPRLIFLSNGPGNPKLYPEQIKVVKELLGEKIPLRGICLGHQLLSLALGAQTYKLPFGQRGTNHPLINHQTGKVEISSQNHGYATEDEAFSQIKDDNFTGRTFFKTYTSLFDGSLEGMATTDHFYKSVQFHPEANPGPKDTAHFFTEIKEYLDGQITEHIDTGKLIPYKKISKNESKDVPYKRILIIGSGPIKIGQASEFDYSGTQACKSLKELGIEVVLLNSNPATIMTDPSMAYRTYIEPITKDTIKKIIKKENVDAVLSTMGGQTALNICVELEKEHYLSENNVELLGANVDTIEKTEDRDLFAKELKTLGYQTGTRFTTDSTEQALILAKSKVGFPLIIRRDFALGGKGAALVSDYDELVEVFKGDVQFPITMEKSLLGFKEIELEVMVDKNKNGVVICSIENVDPCGIHTGDSITVAPAQTISDRCLQNLRTMSLTIAKHMNVVAGGANVQFAINPIDEDDIIVIEMNPRVSRSSALASKATGYPIAKISALLAVGFTLDEILNDITKASPVAFEPTLDYVAIKIPIFPFNKFPNSSRLLGPQMRSVGEVLALGGSFNEAFLKALRSLEIGLDIPELSQLKTTPIKVDQDYLKTRLKEAHELSLLTVIEALRAGVSEKEIIDLSQITEWFIDQAKEIVLAEQEVRKDSSCLLSSRESLLRFKKLGLTDKYLALLGNMTEKEVLKFRIDHSIFPYTKAVDTCSAEFSAKTPYFYKTYFGDHSEASALSNSIVIIGSGPNKIGQGIEFDYSCVKSCEHLKSIGKNSILINSNPETVSTDYDTSDRLYLSPLYAEDVFDILYQESPDGIITSFSGQTGITLRKQLESVSRKEFKSFPFLGVSVETLDLTEDRKLFSEITRKVPLSHTNSREIKGYNKMISAMLEIGTPVIIRPSFVIGGESMYIFNSREDVEELPEEHLNGLKKSTEYFQVENYLENAIEYDVDLIRDKSGNTVFTICEHIEHAGVHSGDSGMISPPRLLSKSMHTEMREISIKLASLLEIIGPINFQYAVKNDEIYCIEANPRGSRTLPFLSKAYNMSLPSIATDALLGNEIKSLHHDERDFYTVKQSTFPFDRFISDSSILGPKMRSTGETLGIDEDIYHATMKSYLGNYPDLGKKKRILISLADKNKNMIIPLLKNLSEAGFEFVSTEGTRKFISELGHKCGPISKIHEEGHNIIDLLSNKEVDLVFNTPENHGESKSDGEYMRSTAVAYGIPCFTRPENIKAVSKCLTRVKESDLDPTSLQQLWRDK